MTNTAAEWGDFSQRERQVVHALLEAKAVKDIASELELSVNTVKDYLKSIYRKAQVHSARELVLKLHLSGGDAEAGLAQFLHIAQALQAAPLPHQGQVRLADAVRRCTRARRVTFWRVVRHRADTQLVSEEGLGTIIPGAFLQRVLERGWARLEPHELSGPEGERITALDLGPGSIGILYAVPERLWVMLAGVPSGGVFGALDLPAMMLLARLAATPAATTRKPAFAVSA